LNLAFFHFINKDFRFPFLDAVLPIFSDKDYIVIPSIAVAIACICWGRRVHRLAVFALLLALAITDFSSEQFVKEYFKEPRPYASLPNVNVYRDDMWIVYEQGWSAFDRRRSNAFPSTHAANIAAASTILGILSPPTLCATLPLSVLVGWSRIYTGNHYPFDVLGGYLWGILCGGGTLFLIRWAARRFWGPHQENHVSVCWERKTVYWIVALWAIFNFVFLHLRLFDLSGDEALYWDMARNLDFGYYSKPPMIAYIIHVLLEAGGHKEWSIRSGAILFSAAALLFLHALTVRISKNEKAGLIAVIAALAAPSTWAGSVIMTIDPVLVCFWAMAMYTFHRAVHGEKYMWLLTGLALGLGTLSKYTMFVLAISFLAYLILCDRRWLRTPWPWLATALALLCLSGVIYWNFQHDWVSIRHTASIGAEGKRSIGKCIGGFFEYLGGQAGAASPILFVFYLWAIWKCARQFRINKDAAFLFLCFAVLFGFYLLVAATRKANINWPICAYTACVVAFGWFWTQQPRTLNARRWLTAALLLGCTLGMAARSTDLLYLTGIPVNPDKDPTNKLRGGREIGDALSKYIIDPKLGPFPFSNRYQMTAWAAFYTKGHPRAYCINPGDRRMNQYDLWGGWENLKGRDGLFVTGGDAAKAQLWIEGMVQFGAFSKGEVLEVVEVRRHGRILDQYSISRLYNYSGAAQTPPAAKY